jgi:hypothetical protein
LPQNPKSFGILHTLFKTAMDILLFQMPVEKSNKQLFAVFQKKIRETSRLLGRKE